MIEQGNIAEQSLSTFVEDVVRQQKVFALQGNEGFATVESIHFEHENGEPVVLMCFWGTNEQANSCKVDDWVGYDVASIELSDFLENWCVGMENDRILAGLNFDNEIDNGYEATTLELILDIIAEIRTQNVHIDLAVHKDIDDLEAQVADVLENGNG